MKIVVDENMPFGPEALSTLGETIALPGRDISKADLADVDALAVRSITKVNASLLEGTPVRGVATATIGTDHLDMAYLDSAGVRHAAAPGCNADSVGDYITSALLTLGARRDIALEGKTLAVVGCGNVGSRVADRGRALGMRVIENDPPLARRTGDERYRPLEEIFEADFITVHTPLERQGEDPTFHLVDEDFLKRMRPEATLLNSSRGAVADNPALKAALRAGSIAGAVLDVWEGEPVVDPELVALVDLATPHIAGYSFDGKVNGTTQVYRHFCRWFDMEPTWDAAPLLPEPEFPRIDLDAAKFASEEDALRSAALTVYPIARDDAALRATMREESEAERGAAFDRLRKEYPYRREFSQTILAVIGASAQLTEKFRKLTFK